MKGKNSMAGALLHRDTRAGRSFVGMIAGAVAEIGLPAGGGGSARGSHPLKRNNAFFDSLQSVAKLGNHCVNPAAIQHVRKPPGRCRRALKGTRGVFSLGQL